MDAFDTSECLRDTIDTIGVALSERVDGGSPAGLSTMLDDEGASSRNIFRSFWMGGYEGADHCNSHGAPLDMSRVIGHTDRADDDYAILADFGIRTVRESAGWRLIE